MKSNVPIIALSASNYDGEMEKCREVGMNACITKPIDIQKLNNLILELKKDNRIIA
jgi:CheY-like chemotaxis protein